MLKSAKHLITVCLLSLLVLGCETTDTIDNPPVPTTPNQSAGFTFPAFDSATGTIPLPNDILRNPQTGFNAVPNPANTDPVNALNALQGWSTTGTLIIPFNGGVVDSSVTNQSLPVYNTVTRQPVPMTYTIVPSATGETVIASPVTPMAPGTLHVAILSNQIISSNSNSPIISDNTMILAKEPTPLGSPGNPSNALFAQLSPADQASIEGLRQALQPIWAQAESLTNDIRLNIPLAFGFTTQQIGGTLTTLRTNVVTANAGLVNPNGIFPAAGTGNPGTTVAQFYAANVPAGVPSAGIDRIFQFTVNAPNYRDYGNLANRQTFFATPPVNTGNRAIPGFALLPAGPTLGTVIFQHGITRNKNDVFALASTLCSNGFAVVAIDLELHGDLQFDLINNATMAPGPDGNTDPDGTGFINPADLRSSRDSLRQSVVNQYALVQALTSGQTDLDGDMTADLNANTVYIGTSLGAMAGTVLHATEPNLSRSVLNFGGGRIMNLLYTSQSFGPLVLGGLAQAGINQGTPEFLSYTFAAQTVVDDADPLNYAVAAIDGNLRGGNAASLLQQVNTTDTVVPAASQYDLARAFSAGTATPDFTQVAAVQALAGVPQDPGALPAGFTGPGFLEAVQSGHGSLLDPTQTNLAATTGLRSEALAFLATGNIIPGGGQPRPRGNFVEVDNTNYGQAVLFLEN